MALLGEMTLQQGKIAMSKNTSRIDEILACHFVRCSISVAVYQGQHPVRIPLDEEWYNAVVECCALKPDLEMGRGQRLGPGLGRSEG